MNSPLTRKRAIPLPPSSSCITPTRRELQRQEERRRKRRRRGVEKKNPHQKSAKFTIRQNGNGSISPTSFTTNISTSTSSTSSTSAPITAKSETPHTPTRFKKIVSKQQTQSQSQPTHTHFLVTTGYTEIWREALEKAENRKTGSYCVQLRAPNDIDYDEDYQTLIKDVEFATATKSIPSNYTKSFKSSTSSNASNSAHPNVLSQLVACNEDPLILERTVRSSYAAKRIKTHGGAIMVIANGK